MRLIDAISFLADIELVRVLYPAKTTFSENEIKRLIQKQNTINIPEIPDGSEYLISPNGFAEIMRSEFERTHGEPEAFHDAADKLMMKILRQFGYGQGVDFFNDQEVWYA